MLVISKPKSKPKNCVHDSYCHDAESCRGSSADICGLHELDLSEDSMKREDSLDDIVRDVSKAVAAQLVEQSKGSAATAKMNHSVDIETITEKMLESASTGDSCRRKSSCGSHSKWSEDLSDRDDDQEILPGKPVALIGKGAGNQCQPRSSVKDISVSKNLGNQSQRSVSDDEDDGSAVSELSGLSGVFGSDRIRRKKSSKHTQQTATTAFDADSGVFEKVSTVKFSKMTVREYGTIISDNPSSANGPSLGIGWEYTEYPAISIDAFEGRREGRRHNLELILDRTQRERKLRRAGFSKQEIAEGTRMVNKFRNQRKQTVNNLGTERVEEVLERARSRVKKMFRRSV